ncbi:histidine phosphatase family protein [Vagococcus carniphilus]|uniref:histidine phosphatase family protein n=1 Tax=Vagococcus carniphilus TaxID=218144 RepID=UPI00288D3637|nr:histidine phosphatase family protein [Vagococcus carniphilus]MDT2840886.1 histidine phosphatase family protein [Vagococcus carniphilus]
MNLYLVRHGQDNENVRGGWCNHGLIEEGIEQSKVLGNSLADIFFDEVYSSDLNRAVETTKIILKMQKNKSNNIVYTDKLREINNGLLAGMKNEVAEKEYPGLYYGSLEFNENYPSGESPEEFYNRIKSFWNVEIIPQNKKNILLVTHGGVINIILHLFNDIAYSNKKVMYPVGTGSFVKIEL